MAPIVEVDGLSKSFGHVRALNGISLSVAEGEVFGFLGPNGAGKTTTIRILLGLQRADSGTAKVGGFDCWTAHAKAARLLGATLEQPALYGFLSGRDNLRLFARLLGPVDEKQVSELLDLVGMKERGDDKVKRYSMGMRQRLALAQAMLGKPKLLILDEPTNGLDPNGIHGLRILLRKLGRQGDGDREIDRWRHRRTGHHQGLDHRQLPDRPRADDQPRTRGGRHRGGPAGAHPARSRGRVHRADGRGARKPAQRSAAASSSSTSTACSAAINPFGSADSVMTFINLVRIELMKTWRSRWIVFAVMGGIFLLIAGGLYTYYVISQHRWNPPPAVAWQTTLRQEIATNQQSITQLQQIKQTQPSGGFRGGFSIDDEIKREQQAIADDQYLIDNNIAPLQSFSITLAALFALGGIVMFLLIRIFGWLASEEIAGERSDRTIAILLSRPMSRDQLLLAKAVASFLISLAVVVVTFLIVYAMVAFIEGSIGPIQGQVGIAVDGTKAVGAGNLVVMPILLFVLMCLGAAMLGVLCVQGMSLLVSVVTGRWAAIGITLAVLFGAPLVSGVVTVIITLISGSTGNAHFLNYFFVNVLAPVSAIAPVFANGPASAGTGMNEFAAQIATLTVWTVAFFGAAWLLFHRKQEAG